MRRLETISVVDALKADLEQRVLDGEFQPGEHLRESELAEQYGVGRHTLRAAFDGLLQRGLLEKAPNRGVFVRVLSAGDLAEVYELRAALEVQAFRMLAEARAVPQPARAALASLRRLSPRPPWRLVVQADLAFHRAIVAGAGNTRLARAHEQLQAEILLCLAQLVHGYASVEQLLSEHTDLLAAIEGGQPAAAEQVIRDHLARATAWLIERASVSPGAEPAPPPATAA